jgi:hypothetical protein
VANANLLVIYLLTAQKIVVTDAKDLDILLLIVISKDLNETPVKIAIAWTIPIDNVQKIFAMTV